MSPRYDRDRSVSHLELLAEPGEIERLELDGGFVHSSAGREVWSEVSAERA